MTNGDKLRQMTDEKLASMMSGIKYNCSSCPAYGFCEDCGGDCRETILEWLKQESEEQDGRIHKI